MKRLQTFLLAVMAVLALGAVVASAASAVTSGLLPLSGTKFPAAGFAFTSTSGAGELNTAAKKPIKCTADTNKGTLGGRTGETEHITLGKEVTITFTGCKQEGVTCRSEAAGVKDPVETILVTNADIHFVALLSGTKLVPGVLVILNNVVVINCGGLKIEVKGTATSEITGYTEGTDVTSFVMKFVGKPLPCDTSDTLCKEQLGKGLRAELGKGEEAAEEITEDTAKSEEMAIIDF